MFKALLAASLAMLACCAAATWAGPVSPLSDPPESQLPQDLPPRAAGSSDAVRVEPLPFDPIALAHESVPVSAEAVPVDAPVQAVIPLPPALYAGAATVALAVLLRRRLLRAVR